ncbi:unnamed protein product [Auanema sp. JU1783]|nr:unnamed protein product [Auanema sp. JU1783]
MYPDVLHKPTTRLINGFERLFMWNITSQSWGLSDSLKKVTVNINYLKGGKIVFKGTTLAGHVGIITG